MICIGSADLKYKTQVTILLYRGLLGLVVDFANLLTESNRFCLGDSNRLCSGGGSLIIWGV